MQINFFKKNNVFKKVKFQFSSIFFWKLINIVVLLILLSSFAFGFFLFKKIDSEVILQVEEIGEERKIIQKDRIQKVIDYFFQKKEKSMEILNSPSPFSDPSL